MLITPKDLNVYQLKQIEQWVNTYYDCLQPYPTQPAWELFEEVYNACYKLALFNATAYHADGMVSFELGYSDKQVFFHVLNEGDSKAFKPWLLEQFHAIFKTLPTAEFLECKTNNLAAHKLLKSLGGKSEGDVITIQRQDLKDLT